MPKYQLAKPFDFVREFKNLQAAVKQLQIQNGGSTGPWLQATLINGWTGTLNYRMTNQNEIQMSAFHLVPGTLTDNTIIYTFTDLIPVSAHEFPVGINTTGTPSSPRIAYGNTGNLRIIGLGTGVTQLSFEVTIPLDI